MSDFVGRDRDYSEKIYSNYSTLQNDPPDPAIGMTGTTLGNSQVVNNVEKGKPEKIEKVEQNKYPNYEFTITLFPSIIEIFVKNLEPSVVPKRKYAQIYTMTQLSNKLKYFTMLDKIEEAFECFKNLIQDGCFSIQETNDKLDIIFDISKPIPAYGVFQLDLVGFTEEQAVSELYDNLKLLISKVNNIEKRVALLQEEFEKK